MNEALYLNKLSKKEVDTLWDNIIEDPEIKRLAYSNASLKDMGLGNAFTNFFSFKGFKTISALDKIKKISQVVGAGLATAGVAKGVSEILKRRSAKKKENKSSSTPEPAAPLEPNTIYVDQSTGMQVAPPVNGQALTPAQSSTAIIPSTGNSLTDFFNNNKLIIIAVIVGIVIILMMRKK